MQRLEILCRIKLSELFQAVLEAEVDQALERVRYERRGDDGTAGYRDGHDRPRTISSNRGPITIAVHVCVERRMRRPFCPNIGAGLRTSTAA